jgi:hypothetical protein
VRLLLFLLAIAIAHPAAAQDAPKKKKQQAAHKKAHAAPTPEQIRKFKELEKKQKKG